MERKRLFIFLTIISIIFLSLGETLAAFTASATATNITQIKSGNLTMTIDGGGNTNASFMPAKCTSEYAIKKKIVATSTNTSGGKVSFSIGMNIATLSDSLKRESMRYTLTTNASSCTQDIISSGSFKNKTVGNDVWLIKNDYDNITKSGNNYSKTYYLYIWLDETETQNLSGSISVNMKGTSSNNPSLTTEANISLGDPGTLYYEIESSADKTTTIDFSLTSAQDNNNGIYMTKDADSGIPVYYYRGNVDNHVLFANFCWRIVRTTETGGVKLIYDGVQNDVHEATVPIEESSYINVINDATYPYTFDSTTKTWVSTNKTHSATGTITFSVNTAGNYVLSYTMSSEDINDKALFYKNDTKLGEHSGTETGTITLTGLTTSDVIKVEYKKDSMSSRNDDTVTFNIGKEVGELIKSCNNTGRNSTIGSIGWDLSLSLTNDKYLGYMYGNSFDDTANTNDSIIKTTIDNWYEANMTNYTSQLEDTVWCNDRSYIKDGSNKGFEAIDRLLMKNTPTLKCQSVRDKFTVSTSNGNGDLTYPVGLITADEMAYAGGKYNNTIANGNSSFYLYNGGFGYFSLTPANLSPGESWGPQMLNMTGNGAFEGKFYKFGGNIRPSISLQPGIAMTGGSGTATDPFVIG